MEVRTHRGDDRVDLDPRSRHLSGMGEMGGNGLHTARRASSAGAGRRRGSSREGRDGRDHAPPHLSTSPLVTPYHSISHKTNINGAGNMTAAYRAAQGIPGLPVGTATGRRPHTASPSDASREELLDRLISLTKEAKVKSPLGMTFEDFEPL